MSLTVLPRVALAQNPPDDAGAKPAITEPSASDVETAKAQFAEGLELRSKGDLAGALQRFRAAYALVRSPITGLELGRTLVASGKVLEGREILLEAARMPKKPDESSNAQKARDDAALAADGAKAKLASLAIDTDFDAGPTIVVDDQPVPAEAMRAPRVLDPGHHVVEVRAKGRVGRAEVDLREGEQRQLHVEVEGVVTPPPPIPHPRTKLELNSLVYVGAVGTGVGLLVGIGTGIGAIVTANTVKNECPNKQCLPPAHPDLDNSRGLGWTSTFAFAAAGAFAVVGVVGLLTSHRVPVQVGVGPGSLVVGGSF